MDPLSDYISSLFAREDDVLLSLREEGDRSGLPPAAISPEVGRLLQVLLRSVGAQRILEVGTLGGYSAIWMARALPPGGHVVTIECEPTHVAFAKRAVDRAQLSEVIEIREGRALDLLPALDGERFDVTLLDADPAPLPTYLDWALRLTRVGGLIIADGALRGVRAPADRDDDATRGVREFTRRFASDPRITGIIIPSHGGIAVGVVGPAKGGP
jgi:predicted O-methyltransferase YrrM